MNKIAHIPKTFIAACAAAALAVAVCMYFVPGVPPMAFAGFAGITAAALAVYGFLCGGARVSAPTYCWEPPPSYP